MGRPERTAGSTQLHSEALAGIWQWVFSPSPSAALRRRITLWVLIAILLAFLFFFSSRTNPTLLGLFTPATLGHVLVTTLAFWLILNGAANLFQALYPSVSIDSARRQIVHTAFAGNYETLHTLDIERLPGDSTNSIAQSGGPGWLKVHLENLAVTERPDGSLRVLGPTSRPALLDGFERIHEVLHLKDQVLTFNIQARSRDGFRLRVEGARLVFSLLRGKREPDLKQPYPFDEQAALNLVLGQRVEQSPNLSVKKPGNGLVAEQGRTFFENQLQEFIGAFDLSALLAGSPQNADDNSGKLLLAREKLRDAFILRCQEPAAAIGLQIQWIDIGTWKMDDHTHAEVVPRVDNNTSQDRSPGFEGEMQQLIDQLLPQYLEPGSEWIGQTLRNFTNLLSELREKYEELKSEPEPQLESVVRFLKLLTKQNSTTRP